MIRTLLATTAITALMTGAAIADSHAATADGTHGVAVFTTPSTTMMVESENGYFSATKGQILGSWLLGQPVYNGTGEEAETVGDVNDVVMAADGQAQAILVGVGGFLGVGEKDVAIDFGRVNWSTHDGERRLVVNTTTEDLENAPAFERATIEEERDMMLMSDNDGMDKENMRADLMKVDNANLSAQEIIGTRVYGANDNDLGEIGDVLLSTDNELEAFIVDVGGFLGLGEKPVALDAAEIEFMQDADGNLMIFTPFSEEQLTNQPEYTKETYMADRDTVVLR